MQHRPDVAEVDLRQGDPLAGDVQPDVEFGPVADGKHPEVLTRRVTRVEQRPELGPLRLGLPLAECIAMAEDPLLRSGFLLVAPRATDQRIEAMGLDELEQGHALMRVARLPRMGKAHAATGDRVFEVADDQPLTGLGDAPVAKGDDLRKIVSGIDMRQRER